MQKTEFLKALSDMWKDFDSRVLRYKVCSVLRSILSSSNQCYSHVSTLCEHHFVILCITSLKPLEPAYAQFKEILKFVQFNRYCYLCSIKLIHLNQNP